MVQEEFSVGQIGEETPEDGGGKAGRQVVFESKNDVEQFDKQDEDSKNTIVTIIVVIKYFIGKKNRVLILQV